MPVVILVCILYFVGCVVALIRIVGNQEQHRKAELFFSRATAVSYFAILNYGAWAFYGTLTCFLCTSLLRILDERALMASTDRSKGWSAKLNQLAHGHLTRRYPSYVYNLPLDDRPQDAKTVR